MRWKCIKCEAIHHYLPDKCKRCGSRKITRKLVCPKCGKTIAYSRVAKRMNGLVFDEKVRLQKRRIFCSGCEAIIELTPIVDFNLKVIPE